MVVRIQLVPTGKRKASGQHKYYSIRLNQKRNKKRSVPPKAFSQNKGSCQGKLQMRHRKPEESFHQETWPQASTCTQLPTRLSMCHFLKVTRQEAYSWPDEKAVHTLNGTAGRMRAYTALLFLPFNTFSQGHLT